MNRESTSDNLEEQFKVYELDFGDTNLLDENINVLLDWIKSDVEAMKDTEEMEYKISIRRMTRKEINELPEWS